MKFYEKYYYDHRKYKFAEKVKEIFDIEDLGLLHTKLPSNIKYNELHKLGEDNKTWYHETFYKPINEGNSDIISMYEELIGSEVSKLLNFDKFLYQRVPTFRVHTPNNIAVGGWHRDRDYNHSPYEINFYMPLNLAKDSSTIWAESREGKEDYSPINGDCGQIIVWDGANLKHGNMVNKTGRTRVSMDFRVMDYTRYDQSTTKETVSASKKLILGDYFKLKEKK